MDGMGTYKKAMYWLFFNHISNNSKASFGRSISAGITLAGWEETCCAFGVSEDFCRGEGLTAVVIVMVTAQIH